MGLGRAVVNAIDECDLYGYRFLNVLEDLGLYSRDQPVLDPAVSDETYLQKPERQRVLNGMSPEKMTSRLGRM